MGSSLRWWDKPISHIAFLVTISQDRPRYTWYHMISHDIVSCENVYDTRHDFEHVQNCRIAHNCRMWELICRLWYKVTQYVTMRHRYIDISDVAGIATCETRLTCCWWQGGYQSPSGQGKIVVSSATQLHHNSLEGKLTRKAFFLCMLDSVNIHIRVMQNWWTSRCQDSQRPWGNRPGFLAKMLRSTGTTLYLLILNVIVGFWMYGLMAYR